MQGPGSLPRSPREHKDHTAAPPGPRVKDGGEAGEGGRSLGEPERQSPQPSLGIAGSRGGAPPRAGRQIPALCRGTPLQARQARLALVSLSDTSRPPPPPAPATTQGHICFGKQPVLSY